MNHDNNISPEELEKIERFLTGEMSAGEAAQFEAQMAEDAQLRVKTEEIRSLTIGISEQILHGKLNEFHDEIESSGKQPGSVVSLSRKLLVAASIMVAGFLAVWWFAFRKTNEEAAYAKLYSPDPGLATVMGNSSRYDFDKAMVEYKNAEYDKALKAWTGLLENNPASDTLLYFIGAAYQAKNDKQSIGYLEKVASDTTSVFYKDANWYVGLYHLKSGNQNKAIEYIERSGHPKSADALKAINTK